MESERRPGPSAKGRNTRKREKPTPPTFSEAWLRKPEGWRAHPLSLPPLFHEIGEAVRPFCKRPKYEKEREAYTSDLLRSMAPYARRVASPPSLSPPTRNGRGGRPPLCKRPKYKAEKEGEAHASYLLRSLAARLLATPCVPSRRAPCGCWWPGGASPHLERVGEVAKPTCQRAST